MSMAGLIAAILLSATSPQEAATMNIPNRRGEQSPGGFVVPADPAEALALAERLESEGRDALEMGWSAFVSFQQALAIRRAHQAPDHPAIAECLYLLSRAYSQKGYAAAAANVLEEADATASGEFGGRIAEMRAREGDYSAVRDYLMADGSLDDLKPWDRTFLDAMVALEASDAATAERGLSIVTQAGYGETWFDLPVHRFRAHIGLIQARQTLGLTAGALSASQNLLTQMIGPTAEDSLTNDLPRREAEQAVSDVINMLVEAGVRADHIGEIGEGARLLEGAFELDRTSINSGIWRGRDGQIRLAEAGLFLGQPNRALAVADRLDELGEAALAGAIRARANGNAMGLTIPVPQPTNPATSQPGLHLTDAYILGVAASIASSDGRPEAATSLAARAVELYRADLTATAESDALDQELAVGRLAAALTVLADAQMRQGILPQAQRSLDEAMALQIAQWCPAASGTVPQAGYGWSRDPRPCLGHSALAISVETGARLAAADARWTAALRLYRHAGDIALGRTLSQYSLQDDAQAEFVRFARFHRATVTSAWQASEDGSVSPN